MMLALGRPFGDMRTAHTRSVLLWHPIVSWVVASMRSLHSPSQQTVHHHTHKLRQHNRNQAIMFNVISNHHNDDNRHEPSPQERNKEEQEPPRTAKETMQKSLPFYLAIETVWHVALFTTCFRYRPLWRLSQTRAGQQWLGRVKERWGRRSFLPNSNHKYSNNKYYQRYVPGGKRSLVAASEWFVLNKVIGIPLLPTKLYLAGWLLKKWEAHQPHGSILPAWWWKKKD